MSHPIMHDWWTECPHCGGNCSPKETAHLSGGPDRGGSHGPADARSYLSEQNGCGSPFVLPPVPAHDARVIKEL